MVWLIGASALAALGLLARGYFIAEARARRRRERSNRPITSRKRGPTVRLAVKTDKRNETGKEITFWTRGPLRVNRSGQYEHNDLPP